MRCKPFPPMKRLLKSVSLLRSKTKDAGKLIKSETKAYFIVCCNSLRKYTSFTWSFLQNKLTIIQHVPKSMHASSVNNIEKEIVIFIFCSGIL
jgi:hypothetical protein